MFLMVSAKTLLEDRSCSHSQNTTKPGFAGPFKALNYKSFISETLLSGKGQQTA